MNEKCHIHVWRYPDVNCHLPEASLQDCIAYIVYAVERGDAAAGYHFVIISNETGEVMYES